VSQCISAVGDWMSSNRLQLNTSKTEVLWCTSGRRQHQLPTVYTGYESLNESHSGLRCLYGSAPEYLTSLLQCVSGIHTRQRLRSASSSDPMVPRTIRSTIGERSFQSAAASTWNALSHSVRSSTSVLQFRSRLKTELFARSYQQSY